jgi:hypothetical protein
MVRLLNTYSNSAMQAKGMIWQAVWRTILVTILLAGSVAFFCRWGVPGAATGVLLVAITNAILTQTLTRRLTGFHWRDLFLPQVPAAICSIGLFISLGLCKVVLHSFAGTTAPWAVLMFGIILSGIYYIAFLLFSGFGDVRDLVCETLDDIAPFLGRRVRALTTARSFAPVLRP